MSERVPKVPKTKANTKSKTPKAPSKPRRFSRKNNGCWTCRRRKVKCDLIKPHCSRCKLSNINCEGYDVKLNWGIPLTLNTLMMKLENPTTDENTAILQGKGTIRRSQIEKCEWKTPYVWYNDIELDLEVIDLTDIDNIKGILIRGPFTKWRYKEVEPVKSENMNRQEQSVTTDILSMRRNISETTTTINDTLSFFKDNQSLPYIMKSIPLLNYFFENQKSIISIQIISESIKNSLISDFFLSQGSNHLSFNILLCIIIISQISKGIEVLELEEIFKQLLTEYNTKIPTQLNSKQEEIFITLLIILSQIKINGKPWILPNSIYMHYTNSTEYSLYIHLKLLYFLENPTRYTLKSSIHIAQSSKYLDLYCDYLDPQYNLLTNVKTVLTGTVYDEGIEHTMLNNGYEKIDIKLSGSSGGKVGQDEYKPRFCINFVNGITDKPSKSQDDDDDNVKLSPKLNLYQYIKEIYNSTTTRNLSVFKLPLYQHHLFLELSLLILQSQYFQREKYSNLGYPRNFPKICTEFQQILKDCPPSNNNTKSLEYKFSQFLNLWYYRCIERYPLMMLTWYVDACKGLELEFELVGKLMSGIGVKFDQKFKSFLTNKTRQGMVWNI